MTARRSSDDAAFQASLRGSFPAVATLEALQSFGRHGRWEDAGALAVALEALIAAGGARGAFLEVDAAPLRPVRLGVGTLRGRRRAGGQTVPLVADDGRPLGTLVVDADAGDADEVAHAVELAVRAAWATEQARSANERLVALDEATRVITGELHLDRVLQLIVDRLRVLVGADYAALGISDARGRIERFITSGITAEERARIGAPPEGHGMLGVIIRERRSLRTDDILAHPESHGFPANHPPMRTLLGVPIVLDGRAVGNLYLTDKNGGEPFSGDDQSLVEMFALRAGIAIDNARLHDQVGRLAVVDERERIGRDLHDGIIQSIYGVSLSLEVVPELMVEVPAEAGARVDRAIDALHKVIGDIREYILDLRPGLGHDDDAVAAIARFAEEVRLNAVVEVDVDLQPGAHLVRALPPHAAGDLLAIAREALSNVARHSGASRTSIALLPADGGVTLEIRDNGRGFDASSLSGPDEHGRHQGLQNMRDRAVGAGGATIIESEPGNGTRIIATLPVASQPTTPLDEDAEHAGDRRP